MELLEQTIEAIKTGKEPSLTKIHPKNVEIDLQIAALIPEVYVGDVYTRLVFYKRIANTESLAGLHDLQIEMIDRFGLLPEPTKNLFRMAELKLLGKTLGIKKIEAGAAGGRIEFEEQPSLNTTALIHMIQQHPTLYKLEGPTRLRFIIPQVSAAERIKNVEKLLIALKL
jgi:transcription-repair coupling factor (superfamily II helicase)